MQHLVKTDYGVLDRPEVTDRIFIPRMEMRASVALKGQINFNIPNEKGIVIGGRLHQTSRYDPLILFFMEMGRSFQSTTS